MKPSRKRIYILIIIAILITGGYFWNKQKKQQSIYNIAIAEMHTVGTGDLAAIVKVGSTAKLVDEQELSFGQEGKITQVYIKPGDTIKAGEILAELDMETYTNSLQTAEIDLANTQLGLQKLINNDTSLREAQLRTQIQENSTSRELETKQRELLGQQLTQALQQKQKQLEQLQRDYNLAEQNLKTAQTGLQVNTTTQDEQLQQSLKTRQQNINNIITSLHTLSREMYIAIEDIDKIFGVSDIYNQQAEAYIDYISTRNTKLRRQIRTKVINTYKLLDEKNISIKKINNSSSDQEIYDTIENFYLSTPAFEDLITLTTEAFDMSNSGPNFSETQLQSFISITQRSKQTFISTRAQLETLNRSLSQLLSIAVQKDQLSVSKEEQKNVLQQQALGLQQQKNSIDLLTKDIEVSKKDKEQQLTRTLSQLRTIEKNTSLLQQELSDLLDGADAYDIQQQQNTIRQTELRVERTREQEDDYQIIAEFDGRVRSVDINTGEQYKLDDRKFIVIENPDLIELELQIGQIDIVKINIGDPVSITFDAYPKSPIQAEISTRNVNPESNGRGGVYYRATIILEKQDLEILAGMTAIVNITTDEVKNTTLVPNLALISKDEKHYVYIKDHDTAKSKESLNSSSSGGLFGKTQPVPTYTMKEITIGMNNNFQTEVITGISSGDIIKGTVLDDEALKDMGIDDNSDGFFGK